MLLRRSLPLAVAVAFVAACSGSDSKTYSTPDVVDALLQQGFKVEVLSETEQSLVKRMGVIPKGVLNVVSDRGRAAGSESDPEDFVVSAWIFSSEDNASCPEPNAFTACIEKSNVVVVVRNDRAEAARAALDDLD